MSSFYLFYDEILSQSLLELSLGVEEVIYCLRLCKLGLCEGELGVIELNEGSAAHLVFITSDTAIQYATDADKNDRKNGYARYACNVDAGGEYKVRARSSRDGNNSEWSDYSSSVFTAPSTPSKISTIRAHYDSINKAHFVYLEWTAVDSATSYDIE